MNAKRSARQMVASLGFAIISLSTVACRVPDPQVGDRRIAETFTVPSAALSGRYGTESHQSYSVFTPNGWKSTDQRNLAVFSHGGAWSFGSAADLEPVALDLLARGSVIVSIEYELGVPAFEQTADIVAATRWAQRNARALGVDADRTFLAGHSAGAHLSVLAAVAPSNLRGGDFLIKPAGVVAVAGPYGVNDIGYDPSILGTRVQEIIATVNDCGSNTCSEYQLDSIAPATYVDASDPAVYMVVGDRDELAPVSHALAIEAAFAAIEEGDRAWVDVVEGAGHQPGSGANAAFLDVFIATAGTF